MEACCFLVTGFSAQALGFAAPLGCSWRRNNNWSGSRDRRRHNLLCGEFVSDLLRGPANDGSMPAGDRLHGRAQVAQQVQTICNLHGIRRSVPSTIDVGAGVIARDHLDVRMRLQPGGKSAGLPILQ